MLREPCSACLTGVLHITPELMTSSERREVVRCARLLGSLERAHHRLREGVTDDRHLRDACSPATARQSSSAIEVPALERDDRVPPQNIAWNDVDRPVPCMSGEAGRCTGDRARRRRCEPRPLPEVRRLGYLVAQRSGTRCSASAPKRSCVPPHHALGHAGGAAGVEEPEVVARALDARHRVVLGDERPRSRPRRRACGGPVVDLDHERGAWRQPSARGLDAIRELAVERSAPRRRTFSSR